MIERLLQNKLFLYLVYGFFLLLPLERIPTIEAGGYTIKISYIFALFIFIFIFFSIKNIKIKLYDNSNLLLIALWMFSALVFLSSPSRRSFIILSMWAFVFLVYFIFSKILTNAKVRETVINIIIFISVLVSLFGLFQFFGDSLGLSARFTGLLPAYTKAILGFPRIQSVALEPLYFANFLLVPIFLSLGKYIGKANFFNKYFWISLLLLLNLGLTVSRGAYIAIVFTLIFLLIYLFISHQYKKIIGVLLVTLLATALSYLTIFKVNGSEAGKGFKEHSVIIFQDTNQDGSSMDRLATYRAAYEYFKERPLLGNGLGSFGLRFTPQEKQNAGTYATVNNEYIELLSENGIIGLALFLAFIISLLIAVIKRIRQNDLSQNNILIPVFLGCLAIFIQYNFFSTLYIIYIWAFLALLKSLTMDIQN